MSLNRSRRVEKIVEALLEEEVISEANDEDFESQSVETYYSSESSSSDLGIEKNEEESEELDEEAAIKALESQKNKQEQRKNEKYVDPALKVNAKPAAILNITGSDSKPEILAQEGEKETSRPQQRLQPEQEAKQGKDEVSSSTTTQEYEQFKMTNEQWVNHLAVTAVWNKMTYNSNIAKTNIEAQEQPIIDKVESGNQERPCTIAWIRGDSKYRVMQDYLEIILGSSEQAHFVMQQIVVKMLPEMFFKLPDSSKLPEDFDYKKSLDCYWRNAPVEVNEQFLVFENDVQNVDAQGGNKAPASSAGKGHQNGQRSAVPTDVNNIRRLKSTGNDAADEQSTSKNRQPSNQSSNRPADESNNNQDSAQEQGGELQSLVNKSTQTIQSIQMENILPLEPGHFIITHIPPKRNYFQRFYVFIEKNIPATGVLAVNLQTDVLAKDYQKKQKLDDTQTFIIVDKKYYDLALFDNTILIGFIKECAQLQIIRGRGRSGKKLADLMHRIKYIRPDLIENEQNLYINVRQKAQYTVEYKAELNGKFLTMYGAYSEEGPKDCQIVDNPLEPMFIDEKPLEERGPELVELSAEDNSLHIKKEQQDNNGNQEAKKEESQSPEENKVSLENVQVGDVYKRPITIGINRRNQYLRSRHTKKMAEILAYQNGGERETDVYRFFEAPEKVVEDGFKYHDPATNKGYNTIAEFQAIRKEFAEQQKQLNDTFDEKLRNINALIKDGKFEKANEEYQKAIQFIEPAWLEANFEQKEQYDTAGRILGEARYGMIE